MGFLGFGKKRVDTIDFTKMANASLPRSISNSANRDTVDLRDTQSTTASTTPDSQPSNTMDFLNTIASSSSPSTNVVSQVSEVSELRTQMRNLTGKLEDSSNEVYRLMQRIELLERKLERVEGRR